MSEDVKKALIIILEQQYKTAHELRLHLIKNGVQESSLPPPTPPATPPGHGN